MKGQAVEIDDRCVAWVRALIDGKADEGTRLADGLEADGAADPLVPLLYYSFAFAMRKLFTGTYTHAQVIKAVARARAQSAETSVKVDPIAAECEILHALGDTTVDKFPDPDARALAQAALLKFAVQDAGLDAPQIDELLNQAREAVTAD
jgi:hypothetical protein